MVKTNLVFSTVTLITFLGLAKGTITSPPDGQRFVFLPGSSHNITWTLNVTGNIDLWFWSFAPRGSSSPQEIASIAFTDVHYSPSPLTVEVFKPGTLRLKNVNQSYNGEFTFRIRTTTPTTPSKVNVYVAVKPTVSIDCSNPLVLNESDSVSCVCRGEGGNPPANVTWFDKDNTTVRGFGVESAILVITGASPNDRGSYRCKAESFNDPRFIDEKSIEIIVNYQPRNTTITLSNKNPKIGESVNNTCVSDGFPPPNIIIHHNSAFFSNKKTYIIPSVNISHNGSYRCEAKNKLGNDLSNVENLIVNEVGQNTSTSQDNGNNNSTVEDDDDDGPNIALIVGIAVGAVFLVVIIVVVIFCCYKSKQKSGYRGEKGVELMGEDNHQHYELDGAPGDSNESHYESVKDDRTDKNLPNDESKPSDSKPRVYASINRENRQGNPLYSSLDPKDAPKRDPTQKRHAPTEYASIDMSNLAPVVKKDDKKGGDKKDDEKKE